MKLLEYQSKYILKKYEIPVPEGKIVTNPIIAKQFMRTIGSDCLLKAQVLSEGRSKSGGIKLVKSESDVDSAFADMLMLKFNDLPIGLILIEQVIRFTDVFNLSLYLDQDSTKPVLVLTCNVETAQSHSDNPGKQMRTEHVEINTKIGLLDYQIRQLMQAVELPKELWVGFKQIVKGSWKMFQDLDVVYLEINPLALSKDKQLVALNAKIIIDEYALFRQSELAEMIDYSVYHPIEADALKAGFSFKKLNGNIGCMANGAALAKATVDLIHQSGKSPANYLDIGACTSVKRLGAAFRLLIAEESINSILINYYGVIIPCDEVAEELLRVRDETKYCIPVKVLFSGLNSEKGINLLSKQSPFIPAIFNCERSLIPLVKE